MLSGRYEVLSQMLASYLHQDWTAEFSDEVHAIDRAIFDTSTHGLKAVLGELREFLSASQSDDHSSSVMLDELGCYFYLQSIGLTPRGWLLTVEAALERELVKRDGKPSTDR